MTCGEKQFKCSTALTRSDSPALSLCFSLTWWIPADSNRDVKEDLNSTRLICSALHLICLDLTPLPLPKPSSAAPVLPFCCTLSPLLGSLPQAASGVTCCNHQPDVLYLQMSCYLKYESKCSALGKHQGSFWITLSNQPTANASQKVNKLHQNGPWFLWVPRELTLPGSHARA